MHDGRFNLHFILSGAITGALTMPLDVMKTRLMIQVDLVATGHPFLRITAILYSLLCLQGQANQYRGFIDCAQTILREVGAGAFLRRLLEGKTFATEVDPVTRIYMSPQ